MNRTRFFTSGAWRPRLPGIEEVPAPIGEGCLACDRAIQADDCGISMIHVDASSAVYRPWHLACFREVLGLEGVRA